MKFYIELFIRICLVSFVACLLDFATVYSLRIPFNSLTDWLLLYVIAAILSYFFVFSWMNKYL
jgi:hypothetical protein